MQSPIPEQRAADAARISAGTAKFLIDGGKIKSIPIGKMTAFNPMRTAPINEDDRPPASPMSKRKEQAIRSYSIREAHDSKSIKAKLARETAKPIIKKLADAGMTTADIARETGLSPPTVRKIASEPGSKIKLNTLCGRQPLLSHEQVRAVRCGYEAGLTYEAMATKYGVSRNCIRDVITGASRGDVL